MNTTRIVTLLMIQLTTTLVAGGPTLAVEPSPPDARLSPIIPTPDQWKQIDRSVDRALAWLATQQRAAGSFPTLDTGQPAVTSLCVLAFLARGHLPDEGRYGQALNRAIQYALDSQQPDGVIAKVAPVMPADHGNASHTSNYNHSISGVMLVEVYGMTKGELNQRIRPAIEKAIKYASRRLPHPKRRSIDEGGWRYGVPWSRDDSDLSITSWHLMFLRSCKNAGFRVPKHLVDEALQYVGRLWRPDPGTFIYAHNEPDISRAMAGAGILSFSHGGRHADKRARQAGDFILKHPFSQYNVPAFPEEPYFYSAFYSSQAMFRPRVFMVRMPSSSFSTSPGWSPKPTFQ